MAVGHEAFWSTMAQLLVVVGGVSAVAFSKALRQLPEGSHPLALAQRLAVLLVGGLVVVAYLVLEAIALFVLAGEATEDAGLRTQEVVWLLALIIVSLLGPGYFLSYAHSVERATERATRGADVAQRVFSSAARSARRRTRRRGQTERHDH